MSFIKGSGFVHDASVTASSIVSAMETATAVQEASIQRSLSIYNIAETRRCQTSMLERAPFAAAATVVLADITGGPGSVEAINLAVVSAPAESTAAGVCTVVAATDIFTKTAHGLVTGDVVTFTSTGTLPAPLVTTARYYVIRIDANTFKLATTSWNAAASTAIDITTAGSGTHSFFNYKRLTFDTKLKITVDGTVLGGGDGFPIALFYCYYGTDGYNFGTWMTDDIGVSQNNAEGFSAMGANRRIFIPFQSTLKVELINASATAVGLIYSDVQYRMGAAPALAWGNRPNAGRLRCHYTDFTDLADKATIDLLPTVTGAGCIDSIQMHVWGGVDVPFWLEGNPIFYIDGGEETFDGTEPFFGQWWYGQWCPAPYSNSWGMPVVRHLQNEGYQTTMFRIFHKDPRPFASSARFRWQNGDPSLSGFAAKVTALVFYYTES